MGKRQSLMVCLNVSTLSSVTLLKTICSAMYVHHVTSLLALVKLFDGLVDEMEQVEERVDAHPQRLGLGARDLHLQQSALDLHPPLRAAPLWLRVDPQGVVGDLRVPRSLKGYSHREFHRLIGRKVPPRSLLLEVLGLFGLGELGRGLSVRGPQLLHVPLHLRRRPIDRLHSLLEFSLQRP